MPEINVLLSPEPADPARQRRRWILPSWGMSLLLHASLMLGVAPLALRTARSLPAEETVEVGIVLKSSTPEATVYETAEEVFAEANPTELLETAPVDTLAEIAGPQASPATIPELQLEESILGTASQAMRQAQAALPPAARPGGQPARTKFFSAEAQGHSFVWVIDRSASMAYRNAIELAKQEALKSVSALSPQHTFQMIFYNNEPEVMPLGEGRMLEATRARIVAAKRYLGTVQASGGTQHHAALLAAFALQPEVIYFLTDADDMTEQDVHSLTRVNRRSRPPATIYAIEFGNGLQVDQDKPLRLLAELNDGTYTYVNVLGF